MKFAKITALSIFVFIIAIVVTSNLDVLPLSITSLYSFPYGDKIGHFLLMGTFAFFVNLSLNNRTTNLLAWSIPTGSLLVIILSSIEEFSQNYFPSRTPSFLDLAFSVLGILVIGSSSLVFKAVRPKSK